MVEAHNDIKIKRLRKKFGNLGVGVWWLLVEIVGKEGSGGYLEFKRYPKEEMAEYLGVPGDMLNDILKFMAEVELLSSDCLPAAIFIPKLVDLADNWTKDQEAKERKETIKRLGSKKEVTSKADTPGRTLLLYYIYKYKEEVGVEYSVNWGRGGKIMAEVAKLYGVDTGKELINEFIESANTGNEWWSDKLTVPVFKSQLNTLIGRIRKKK